MCLVSMIGIKRSQYHEGVDLWVDLQVDLRVDAQLVGDANTTLFTPEKQSEWWG